MKIAATTTSVILISIIQYLMTSIVFAGPAPNISSFEIYAVGTGASDATIQWTYMTTYQSYVNINGGSKLYVRTKQMGYDAYQIATFKGSRVSAADDRILIYNPYPFVVGFIDQWDCGVPQSGTFTAVATSINNYVDWPASIYISINPSLSVTKQGNGTGTITPDSGTLSWNGNIGTGTYTANTLVSLLPTASAGSSFDGWNGACTNSSGTCDITMDTDKSVSATFSVIPNARIGDTYYGTLGSAYSAVSADGVIESKELTFVEDLTLDRDISFTLKGGYADDFSSITGFTTLSGILTISSGSMIVDGLSIQ